MIPSRFFLVVLLVSACAAPAAALAIAFDVAPAAVAKPGTTLGPWSWTLSDATATVSAVWSPANTRLGSWVVTREAGATVGTLGLAIPATAPPGTYTFILKATLGAVTATSSHQIRFNKPPTLLSPSQPVTSAIAEDAIDGSLELAFSVDDTPNALSFELLNPTGTALITTCHALPGGKSARLTFLLTPDQFTANPRAIPPIADPPCTVTLRASDVDGSFTDIPVTITVNNVNDAPVITLQPGAADPLPYDPAIGALVAIDPLVNGLPAFAPSEPLDRDCTRTRAGSTSTYLRWRCVVEDGVDGGDLLKPVGDGVTWQVSSGNLQRKIGSTWTTVATWNRSADGTTINNRSDNLSFTLTSYAVVNATRDDVTDLLRLVHYAWLLGAPAPASPWLHRSIHISCDEPRDTTANLRDTTTFDRGIILQPPNHAPLVSGLTMAATPLGETSLPLSVLDDGRAPGCSALADVTLSLTAAGIPGGGVLFHRALPGHPLTPGEVVTVADLLAGDIAYRHTEPTVCEDALRLCISDGDLSVEVAVAITIAMDQTRLGLLSDPLLVLNRPASGTATWPLRFTHTLAAAPVLGSYPGLPAPLGVSIAGAAQAGWYLVFDWPNLPTTSGYVAFVVQAHTDDASATFAADASQAMLVRLLDPAVASPIASPVGSN